MIERFPTVVVWPDVADGLDCRVRSERHVRRDPMTAESATDHELIHAWKQGDKAAGDALVCRHFDRVYRFFFRKIDGPVEDLTQMTFLRSLELSHRLTPDASFGAYLLGIARNILLEHFKSQARDVRGRDDTLCAGRFDTTPTQSAALREGQRRILGALRRIPLEFQITVELFYWEGLTIPEIAEVLGVASGTVKSRLHRAKALLKERLDETEGAMTDSRTTGERLRRWISTMRDAAWPSDDPGVVHRPSGRPPAP